VKRFKVHLHESVFKKFFPGVISQKPPLMRGDGDGEGGRQRLDPHKNLATPLIWIRITFLSLQKTFVPQTATNLSPLLQHATYE
jgi:hypothetical protein